MDLWKLGVLLCFACFLQHSSGVPTEEQVDCTQCVEGLQTVMDYARNEMALTDNLDPVQICRDAPPEFQPICQGMLSSYGNDLNINLNTRHMTAFCKMIGQCGTVGREGNGLVFDAEIEPDLFELGSNVEGLPCILCENLMKIAMIFLKDKQHQLALYRLLKGACTLLPFFKTKCEHLVTQYGMFFIHMASHWLKPELCKLFHLCPAKLANNKDSCRMCEFSVGIIQDSLDDPALENRVILAMDELCESFGNDAETCNDLASDMREYLPDVIKSVREKAQLKDLCQDSGICTEAASWYDDSEEDGENMSQWTEEEVKVL